MKRLCHRNAERMRETNPKPQRRIWRHVSTHTSGGPLDCEPKPAQEDGAPFDRPARREKRPLENRFLPVEGLICHRTPSFHPASRHVVMVPRRHAPTNRGSRAGRPRRPRLPMSGAHLETPLAIAPLVSASTWASWARTRVVNWFVALFRELGYAACSSHSGRRSFITMAARNVHRSGRSLRDVQLLGRSRRRSATSMATPACRGDWLRTFGAWCAVKDMRIRRRFHERSIQRVRRGAGSDGGSRRRQRGTEGRREIAASESGTPMSELDESDLIECADDEFCARRRWGPGR
jgi:hypothetical protein